MGAGSSQQIKVKEPELLSIRVLADPVTENVPESGRQKEQKQKKPNAAYQLKMEQIAERKRHAVEYAQFAKAHVQGTIELEAPKEGKYFHKVEKPQVPANFTFSDGTKQWNVPKSQVIEEDITSEDDKKPQVEKANDTNDTKDGCISESSATNRTDVSLPIEFDQRVVNQARQESQMRHGMLNKSAAQNSSSFLIKGNWGSQDFFKQDIKGVAVSKLVDQYNDTFGDGV